MQDHEFLRRRWLRVLWVSALLVTSGIALALTMLGSWAEDRVRASLEARTYIERFQNSVVDAERAQRAYILTHDQDYLADYSYALIQTDTLKEQLTESLTRNRLNLPDVEELYRLSTERNRQLSGAIDVLEAQGFNAAVERVRQNEVRQTTQQIFDLTAQIDEEENRLLSIRQDQVTLARVLLLAALIGTMAGTVAVSSLAIASERSLRTKLAELNTELGARVEERTLQLEAEKRRVEHILADLSHRLGNNLAMISSHLMLQARRTEDDGAREALEDVNRRILSVASAQRRLQVDTSSGLVEVEPYLSILVHDLQATLLPPGIKLGLAADPIALRSDDVVALGVIVNELIINALKHAFPDGKGRLDVELRQDIARIVLTISDDGQGVNGNVAEGLGSLVVRSMFSALNATSSCTPLRDDPSKPGTRWVITFAQRVNPTDAALSVADDEETSKERLVLH